MGPPSIVTPALLSAIRAWPHLPQHTWYFIAGVTLSVLNRPDEIGPVLQYALRQGPLPDDNKPPAEEEQLRIARRMREGLVKSVAVVGLPKTINALLRLKDHTPAALLDTPHPTTNAPATPSSPKQLPPTPTTTSRAHDLTQPSPEILSRGTSLFGRIYGKVTSRVMSQMDNCGTPDLGVAARVGYGYLLSGGGDTLTEPETSLVLLAALVPQDVRPQLKGHLQGAVNMGGSREGVSAVRSVVVRICEEAGMRRLGDGDEGEGWGWWDEVADLKQEKAKL